MAMPEIFCVAGVGWGCADDDLDELCSGLTGLGPSGGREMSRRPVLLKKKEAWR